MGFVPFGVWREAFLAEATLPFWVAVERENGKITVKSNKINISCNDTALKANYGIRVTDSLNVDIEGNTVADNGTVVHLESGIRLESSEGCRIIKNKNRSGSYETDYHRQAV